jgi:metacaspase-1
MRSIDSPRASARRCATLAAAALAAGALTLGVPLRAAPRALLIGVGDIPGYELPAIELDIQNMQKVAAVLGFAPGDIKVLFGKDATYANVQRALSTWVRDGVRHDDRVLIYFSGHGTRLPDLKPGSDTKEDDALVLHDVARTTIDGKATLKNVLMGRELGEAIAAIPSQDVLVMVDACHSGAATRDVSLGNLLLGVGSGVRKFYSYPGMPDLPARGTRALKAPLSDNFASLSAARDDESAIGTEQGGLFTLAVSGEIVNASRSGQHPSIADLRDTATAFIATHVTKKDDVFHPVAEGNDRLIKGAIDVVPLRNGQGPTWLALLAAAAKGEPMKLSGAAPNMRVGQELALDVSLPRDGYLNVVAVDSEDRATVLYPNKYNPTNSVKAGDFRFPTPQMPFVLRASEPLGPSLIVAFLTDKPVNLLELGIEGRDAAGKMQQAFTEVSARATRAISVEARESHTASGQLTVNVSKATH